MSNYTDNAEEWAEYEWYKETPAWVCSLWTGPGTAIVGVGVRPREAWDGRAEYRFVGGDTVRGAIAAACAEAGVDPPSPDAQFRAGEEPEYEAPPGEA